MKQLVLRFVVLKPKMYSYLVDDNSEHNMEVLKHFATKILHESLTYFKNFLRHFPSIYIYIYIRKYLKQFSTCYDSKCFNSFFE